MYSFENNVEEKGIDMYVSFVRKFVNFPDHLLTCSGTGNHKKSDWQLILFGCTGKKIIMLTAFSYSNVCSVGYSVKYLLEFFRPFVVNFGSYMG
jgi:hypothetical protein